MKDFEDTISVLEYVAFASKNRQRTEFGSRLNWALIESPNHGGAVRYKPPKAFCSSLNSELQQYVDEFNPEDRILKVSDKKMAGMWACQGGRGGVCDGKINRMYRRVKWDDGFGESIELEVVPVCGSRRVCQEGDAGSWVANNMRELVGMLTGMDEHRCGILTPLKDIMVDVERATGHRVPLPQPQGRF